MPFVPMRGRRGYSRSGPGYGRPASRGGPRQRNQPPDNSSALQLFQTLVGALTNLVSTGTSGRTEPRGGYGGRARGSARTTRHPGQTRRPNRSTSNRPQRGRPQQYRDSSASNETRQPQYRDSSASNETRQPQQRVSYASNYARPPPRNIHSEQRNEQFKSENPDFTQLVRNVNLGARIQHAQQNWERLPTTVDRAIDRIAESIRPPMINDSFTGKIKQAAGVFKNSIRHSVNEHLVSGYAKTQRSLQQLDNTDQREACSIARKQILRANSRINTQHVDDLLSVVNAHASLQREDWRTVNKSRGLSKSIVAPTTIVETHNRFNVLESNLDEEGILEILGDSMEESTNVPPPQPQRTKRREVSPPTVAETPKKQKITGDDQGFRVPNPVNPPASDPPREATTPTSVGTPEVAPGYVTPIPSPSTSGRRLRLSSFQPRYKSTWAIPEIKDDETTLLIADSNGCALAGHTPQNCRVAAYRGGKIADVNRLLESCPLPEQINTVVIAVGLNDRTTTNPPLVNVITRLRELLYRQPRHIRVLPVPDFAAAPAVLIATTSVVNQLLQDLFGETGWLVPLASDFLAQRVHKEDFAHYNDTTACELVSAITSTLRHLN